MKEVIFHCLQSVGGVLRRRQSAQNYTGRYARGRYVLSYGVIPSFDEDSHRHVGHYRAGFDDYMKGVRYVQVVSVIVANAGHEEKYNEPCTIFDGYLRFSSSALRRENEAFDRDENELQERDEVSDARQTSH